jgi:hypothetical protein
VKIKEIPTEKTFFFVNKWFPWGGNQAFTSDSLFQSLEIHPCSTINSSSNQGHHRKKNFLASEFKVSYKVTLYLGWCWTLLVIVIP